MHPDRTAVPPATARDLLADALDLLDHYLAAAALENARLAVAELERAATGARSR